MVEEDLNAADIIHNMPAIIGAMDFEETSPLVFRLLFKRIQDLNLSKDFVFHLLHAATKSEEFFFPF